MNFNIFNSLIFAGVLQGFIFVIVFIAAKKYKDRSTFFLLALILVYSLGNLQYLLSSTGLMLVTKMYKYVYLPWASLIPVLLYFYCILFLYPTKKTTFKEKLLFLPFLVFLLFTFIYRTVIIIGYKNDSFYEFFYYLVNFHEILGVVFSILILLVLIRTIIIYDNNYKEFKIDLIRSNLNWLKTIITILVLLTFIWGYLMFRSLYLQDSNTPFYILWIGIALVIYLLGHIGIYKFGIIEERKKIRSHVLKNKKLSNNKQLKNEHIIALENLLLHDKLYLDSGLTLESVAKHLQLSASYLSRIINTELEISFTDYLNRHRIEEAKAYLDNPEFSRYTIVAIGLEAGFNSKSTFFYVFKKVTGKTPLAYQREMKIA
jgi:AraC-like DNA-binding protein